MKRELKHLQRLEHENLIGLVESYGEPASDEVIFILEYCPYGNLKRQMAYWTEKGELVPEAYLMFVLI